MSEELYEERKVASLEELKRQFKELDQDAGIRIVGNDKIIFAFYYDGKYWLNLTEEISEIGEFLSFHNFENAWEKLIELIKLPLNAWVY